MRCDLSVKECLHLDVVAARIDALIGNQVGKKCGVVSAAAGASDASSCGGLEGAVFVADQCLRKRQKEVRLYPGGKVLGGQKVRPLVLRVCAPALLVGRGRNSCGRRVSKLTWLAAIVLR